MKMEKKKSGEITFQDFFDLMKQQLLTPLKEKGFTEKEINEMTMERVNKELEDISKKYTKLLDVELQKIGEKQKKEPIRPPTKPVDFENMFKEIKAVREKYNIPKTLLFVPDKLEIAIKRVSYDNFNLSYKEFFTYVPEPILKVVMLNTINMLTQIGVSRELITRIDGNGVGVEMSGDFFHTIGGVLPELLRQKRLKDEEIFSLFNSVQKGRQLFADFSDFEYEWNSEIGKRFNENVENALRVMQEHPSVQEEFEAIVKKYTQRSEKTESEDKQSNLKSEK